MEHEMKHKIEHLDLEFEANENDVGWLLANLAAFAALAALVHAFKRGGERLAEHANSGTMDTKEAMALMQQLGRAQELMFEGADVHTMLTQMRDPNPPAMPDPADVHPMPGVAQ